MAELFDAERGQNRAELAHNGDDLIFDCPNSRDQMTKKSDEARSGILNAATKILCDRGAERTTISAVADEAGCAKGLVNYHFKSKDNLLAATLRQLADSRLDAWQSAFKARTPEAVIDRTWKLILDESRTGVLKAMASSSSCPGVQTERTVKSINDEFADAVGVAAEGLLAKLGMTPRFPVVQLGALMAAVANGIGLQLSTGGDAANLENSYAVAWLGVLQMSEPRKRQRRRRRR